MNDPAPIGERVATIEEKLDNCVEVLEKFSEDSGKSFSEINTKVDAILLEDARSEGERAAIKKLSGIISAVVAASISFFALVINACIK